MKKISYRIPLYLIILMNIFGFLLLYMGNSYDVKVIYIGLGLMAFFVAIYVALLVFKMGDRLLFLIVSMIITIGVLMLCRISLKGRGLSQIMWVGLGGIVFFAVYVVYSKIKFWDKLWFAYAGLGLVLFLAIFVLGEEVKGARNWINKGPIQFQPSEIVKISYVFFLACYYSESWNKPFMKFSPMLVTAGVTYAYMAILLVQKDLGTILIIFLIYFFMMYVYEKKRWFVLLTVGVAVFAVIVLALGIYMGVEKLAHVQTRIDTWLDPWEDPTGKGYQVTQSLYAISSGGAFGMGLGNATLGTIPEVYNDYIFAAICAEMGIFGGSALIMLFFLLSYRCFKIALKTKNAFNKAVAVGISFIYSFQTFIIIGGVIKLIPLTGVTVPFVSSGGSSMISSFAALGIIQAISAMDEREEENSD